MSFTGEQLRVATTQQAAEWFTAHRMGHLSHHERAQFVMWLKESPANVREYLAVAAMLGDMQMAVQDGLPDLDTLIAAAENDDSDRVVAHPSFAPTEAKTPQDLRASHAGARDSTSHLHSTSHLPGFRRWYPIAAFMILAAVGVGWWLGVGSILFGMARTYETAHGEQRTLHLRDGSVMHLNSGSRVLVSYSDTQRAIEITRGQALFQVARDTARPFRVLAGRAEVVAVGTEFDVYRRENDDVVVTVVEGEVAVHGKRLNVGGTVAQQAAGDPGASSSTSTSASSSGSSEVQPSTDERAVSGERGGTAAHPSSSGAHTVTPPLYLRAGQRVHIAAMPLPVQTGKVDVRQAVAWIHRQIIFEQQPLAEVTEEFNRYGRVPIVIEGESLQKLRISGVFNAYDTNSYLEFLRRLENVSVERGTDRIRIVPLAEGETY